MERKIKILKEMEKKKYWKPNFTSVSKKLKVPGNTIQQIYDKNRGRFDVKIRLKSDLEMIE